MGAVAYAEEIEAPPPQQHKTRGNAAALAPYRIKPGEVRNPTGRPKLPAEVREAAMARTVRAIEILGDIMENESAPEAARIAAADKILDRALGKAPQSLDVNTRKDDAYDYSIAELVAIAYRRGFEGSSVEHEPGSNPGIEASAPEETLDIPKG